MSNTTSALGTIGASPRNLEPRASNAPGDAARDVAKRVNSIKNHVVDVETCERKKPFRIPCALPSRSVLFVLLYSSLLLATPVCLHHVSIDFESNVTRGLLIGGSAVVALTISHGGS